MVSETPTVAAGGDYPENACERSEYDEYRRSVPERRCNGMLEVRARGPAVDETVGIAVVGPDRRKCCSPGNDQDRGNRDERTR